MARASVEREGPAGSVRLPGRPARRLLWLAPALTAALAGCETSTARLRSESRYYVKPTIAVVSFQAAPSAMGLHVGDGLADVLTDELVKTERFHVVERPNIGAVLDELRMQRSDAMRTEGKAKAGRLKNVEYLIKGKVTDFGHVSSNDLWARLDMLNAFGARHKAIMRMTFYVVEVESGEIVASRTVTSTVRVGRAELELDYKKIGFGGGVFYQTPLGKATAQATRKAVCQITKAIATQPWQPRIAMIRGEQIILNGGTNRGIKPGSYFRAHQFGEVVVDPTTGNVLGRLSGKQVGHIEVTEVHDRYAIAKATVRSRYHIGQHLAAVVPDKP